MEPAVPRNAFAHPLQVAASLVDLQGHVANHEIVRLFVEAAAEHSTALGWDLARYRQFGAWWVVRRHEVDYVAPAREGDRLVCYTWPSGFSKARAERKHVLLRPSDGSLIAHAVNTWALIDMKTGRPRRIDAELFRAFDPAQWVPPPGGPAPRGAS